jgi:prevent-host-death family protein
MLCFRHEEAFSAAIPQRFLPEVVAMTYSTQEVRTKLDEILEKVKEGERVVITLRGEEVAEIFPVRKPSDDPYKELEEQGIISPPGKPPRDFTPLAELPGTLAWFLENRD